MRHRVGVNRLDRRSGHRKALKSNMVTSLFRYERIETTKPKALVIRSLAEKMITRAKTDSVHNRRIIARSIRDPGVLAKLFTVIGPRYVDRPGGYTRVLRLGRRPGDAADMVFLELLDRTIVERKKRTPAEEESADQAAEDEGREAPAKARKTSGGEDAADSGSVEETDDTESAGADRGADDEPAVSAKKAPAKSGASSAKSKSSGGSGTKSGAKTAGTAKSSKSTAKAPEAGAKKSEKNDK